MMKLKFFVKLILRWFSQLRHKLRIKAYGYVTSLRRIKTSQIIKELEEISMVEMSHKEAQELRKQLAKCKTIEDQKKILAAKGIEFTFGERVDGPSEPQITADNSKEKEETKDDNQGITTKD